MSTAPAVGMGRRNPRLVTSELYPMPIVQVFFRTVYGNQLIYPACVVGEQLAAFAGVKTFNRGQIAALRAAGLTIETVADPRAVAMLQGAA